MFVACALAVFGYVAQLANTVGLVTCTDTDAPGATSPKEQFNVPDVIEQLPDPAYGGLIDHAMPVPVGNGSESVTDFAVPVPAALEFETVMVKPIFVPALTADESAVFVIESVGH